MAMQKLLIAIPLQGCTGFCADSICQALEIHGRNKQLKLQKERKKEKDYDEVDLEPKTYSLRRSAIFASVGAFIIGPLGILRYSLYDALIPGNRLWVEVPIKTAIECTLVTPIMAALGMGINEYMKPGATLDSVTKRLKKEYWKVLLAGYLSKIVTTFFLMSFPGSMAKFCVGLGTGLVLNIFNSWRINVALEAPPVPAKTLSNDDEKEAVKDKEDKNDKEEDKEDAEEESDAESVKKEQ